MNLSEMKVGQIMYSSKKSEVNASIDEASYKTRDNKRLLKNSKVTLTLGDNNMGEFEVHRILGQSLIILREKGKKINLSLLERLELAFKAYKNSL